MAKVEVSKGYLYFSTENINPLCLPWVFYGKAQNGPIQRKSSAQSRCQIHGTHLSIRGWSIIICEQFLGRRLYFQQAWKAKVKPCSQEHTLPAGLTCAGTAKALQAPPPSHRERALATLQPQLAFSENRVTWFLCQDHLSQGNKSSPGNTCMRKWPVLGKHNLHHYPQNRKNYRCYTQQTLLTSVSLTGNGGCEPRVSWRSLCQILKSCSSERRWFVPGKVSCLLLPPRGHAGHFTSAAPAGTSSFPAAGGQGGTELFQSQSCLQPAHRAPAPKHWHRQAAFTCLLPPAAPSVEAATAKLLPTEKKGPQIPGFRTYGDYRSRRNRLQNMHHHSTRCTEIVSLLCEAQTVSDLCLRDCQSWVGTKCIWILWKTVVSMATCVMEEG